MISRLPRWEAEARTDLVRNQGPISWHSQGQRYCSHKMGQDPSSRITLLAWRSWVGEAVPVPTPDDFWFPFLEDMGSHLLIETSTAPEPYGGLGGGGVGRGQGRSSVLDSLMKRWLGALRQTFSPRGDACV